jgi:hypothetical protein
MFMLRAAVHLANDWRVDDWCKRFKVVDDNMVEQRDIVAEELRQDEVLA